MTVTNLQDPAEPLGAVPGAHLRGRREGEGEGEGGGELRGSEKLPVWRSVE